MKYGGLPFCNPRSSSGNTSGRSRLNIRNISAVQRPMPRTSTSSAMISSSDICGQRCSWILPSAKCCARSAMYSVLRSDRPQARSSVPGSLQRHSFRSHFGAAGDQAVPYACAAFTEICWPQMARASVMNGSPRRTMKTFGCARMIAPITGSRRARARFAPSSSPRHGQASFNGRLVSRFCGFIFTTPSSQRQGEVDRAAAGCPRASPPDRRTAARRCARMLRMRPWLDLAARPQLVQDRGRLRVEADVPGPARLVDLPHRLYLDLQLRGNATPMPRSPGKARRAPAGRR